MVRQHAQLEQPASFLPFPQITHIYADFSHNLYRQSRVVDCRGRMNRGNIFAELKRRNVYKVAVAYIVVGWALAQGIAQVFPVFDIPNWAVRLMVLAIVIGFPIALVIAWAFELTPEGIKRTEDVDPAVDSRAKSHAWIYVMIVAALFSVGLFFVGRY